MRRIRAPLVATLLLLLAAAPALAQKPAPDEKEILHAGKFIVYSNEPLDVDRAKALVARLEPAYDFVAHEEGWADDAVLAHDLGVRVVSDVRMKEISKK